MLMTMIAIDGTNKKTGIMRRMRKEHQQEINRALRISRGHESADFPDPVDEMQGGQRKDDEDPITGQ